MIYNVMDINTIEYKGKKYIVRDVESEDGAYIEIGSKFLSKALITPDGVEPHDFLRLISINKSFGADKVSQKYADVLDKTLFYKHKAAAELADTNITKRK